jgi:hypothetical protein
MKKKLVWQSLAAAIGEVAYVSLVALIMTNGEKFMRGNPGVLGGVYILTLFVISASVSAALIFGGPVLVYLEGKKKDAVKLFISTIGWLVLFMLLAMSFLILYHN